MILMVTILCIHVHGTIFPQYPDSLFPFLWTDSGDTPSVHHVLSPTRTSQLCVPELNPSDPRTEVMLTPTSLDLLGSLMCISPFLKLADLQTGRELDEHRGVCVGDTHTHLKIFKHGKPVNLCFIQRKWLQRMTAKQIRKCVYICIIRFKAVIHHYKDKNIIQQMHHTSMNQLDVPHRTELTQS